MRLLGAVLAGGRSSRFGSDKARALMADGRSLLDHAVAALAPHVEAVAVCGRAVEGLLSLADRPAPDLGPLGGLAAALHHARERGFDAVLTTGCDMPVFPARLAAALIDNAPAVLQGQPLAGCWPVGFSDALDAHLAATEDRSIRAWVSRAGARTITLPDMVLPNINRPADLDTLQRDRS